MFDVYSHVYISVYVCFVCMMNMYITYYYVICLIFIYIWYITTYGWYMDAMVMPTSFPEDTLPGYVRIAAEEYSLDDFGDRFFGTISVILALESYPPRKRSHDNGWKIHNEWVDVCPIENGGVSWIFQPVMLVFRGAFKTNVSLKDRPKPNPFSELFVGFRGGNSNPQKSFHYRIHVWYIYPACMR